jgi:ligand-binding sensor domain-containing protein
MASDHVRAICSDRLGNVWFGTEAGLSRFDGSQRRAFRKQYED